jgi:hypothetical protein
MAYTGPNDDLVGMWKVAVVVYLEVLLHNYPEGAEEKHETRQPELAIDIQIRCRSRADSHVTAV